MNVICPSAAGGVGVESGVRCGGAWRGSTGDHEKDQVDAVYIQKEGVHGVKGMGLGVRGDAKTGWGWAFAIPVAYFQVCTGYACFVFRDTGKEQSRVRLSQSRSGDTKRTRNCKKDIITALPTYSETLMHQKQTKSNTYRSWRWWVWLWHAV